MEEITCSKILGSRLSLFQPCNGYRVAIDSVLLAAAIPAKGKDRILDVGAGTGAASLALLSRIDGVLVEGVEIQEWYANLAKKNAEQNGLQHRVKFLNRDISELKCDLFLDNFNHVMSNPPFLEKNQGRVPSNQGKAKSNIEGKFGLVNWIKFCIRAVKTRGTVTIIHRVDRLTQILSAFDGKVGGVTIYPLWPRLGENQQARRVLIQCRKGVRSPTQLSSGLILHNQNGGYTEEAKAILSGAKGINLSIIKSE